MNSTEKDECDIIGDISEKKDNLPLKDTTDEKVSGIYKIVNKTNNKYYVGSAKNIAGRQGRWYQHKLQLKENKHSNDHLQNSWNKYGENNFDLIVIEKVNEKDLLLVEQKYLDIAKNEQDKCYNLRFIAGGGGELSDYTRKKMSDNHKGKPMTLNNKLALIKANTGKIFSKEHRQKIGIKSKERNTGRILTKEHKEKLRISMIGNKNNPNTSGNKNPKYNHTIYVFTNTIINDTFKGTCFEFRIKYNLCPSDVSCLIHKKYKQVKGWSLFQSV